MNLYNIKNIKRVVKNPSLVPKAAKIAAIDINRRWYKYWHGFSKFDIFDEEWDNLILIDAARYDLFSESSTLPREKIESRESPGSYSLGFMEKSFFGKNLHDTVYVSSNPYTNKIPGGTFHTIINLLEDKWDEELGTVLPESVIESAVDAHDRFPNKRLIIHFMQPHYPFVGDVGKQINSGFDPNVDTDQRINPWNEQMWGNLDNSELLLEAYRENHEIAAENAVALAKALDGKTVISADHANLIGERGFPIPMRIYGHPQDFPHPNLLKVPWVELDGDRRSITADTPVESKEMDESIVDDRLEALGYK